MQTSLKTGFAQIFSCCPKKSELPKIWGGAVAPLAPPARTPMSTVEMVSQEHRWVVLGSMVKYF